MGVVYSTSDLLVDETHCCHRGIVLPLGFLGNCRPNVQHSRRVVSEVIWDELASSSKVTLDQNESFAASRNRSYTTLFSYQQRQENKAKLACLASEYQFRFCSQLLSIYFTLCLPRQWRQKCLLAPTNVISDDARGRQFGVAVFHEPRINPQAHGIPL